jgi:hypothetical protein
VNPEIIVLPGMGIWEADVAWTEKVYEDTQPVFVAPGLPS